MVNLRRFFAVMGVLLCVAVGCSSGKSPAPNSPQAPSPVGHAEASTQESVPLPESAKLFPSGDSEWEYKFDDGTQETHEWWLWDGPRLTAANTAGVIAVWHFAPSGVYRQDPLGGPKAPYLRYLPAKLADDQVWSQPSGDAVVRFRLTRVYERTIGGPEEYWVLQVLNRGRLQRLEFWEKTGMRKASLLSPSIPSLSYHKVGGPAIDKSAPPVSRAEWLRQADKNAIFRAEESPPVTQISPEDFQREVSALLKPVQQVPGGPLLLPIINGQPPLLLYNEEGSKWERLVQPNHPCVYQVRPGASSPYLYELCGSPVEFGGSTTQAMTLRVWNQFSRRLAGPLWWSDGSKAAVDHVSGLRIDVSAAGEIVVQQASWRHLLTTVYTITSDGNQIKERRYTTPDGVAYPDTPEVVLQAAFFARWNDIRDEVPLYFSTTAAAQVFLELIPGEVTRLDPVKAKLGAVERITPDKAYERFVKVTPEVPMPGQSMGFAVETLGCCGWLGAIWGDVRFEVDSAQHWKIAQLSPKFVQEGEDVKAIK